MYSSVRMNHAGRLYSGGRKCSSGRRLNGGGGVLSAAWSEAAKQSGCGTVTSTAEAPTDVYIPLTANQ